MVRTQSLASLVLVCTGTTSNVHSLVHHVHHVCHPLSTYYREFCLGWALLDVGYTASLFASEKISYSNVLLIWSRRERAGRLLEKDTSAPPFWRISTENMRAFPWISLGLNTAATVYVERLFTLLTWALYDFHYILKHFTSQIPLS